MRIVHLISLAVLMACLNTCKKNSPPIVDVPIDPIDTIILPPIDSHIIELGRSFVLKNGEIWDVPFSAWFTQNDSGFVLTASKNYSDGVRQSFRIDDIPLKPGLSAFEFWPSFAALHPNQIPQTAFIMIYEEDEPIGDFFLDTLRNDHLIEVLRYDTLTHIAEGRFKVFLKKNDWGGGGASFPGVPDSIIMSEGKFQLEVKHF